MEGKLCFGLLTALVLLFHLQVPVSGSPLLIDQLEVEDRYPCSSPDDCLADECCLIYDVASRKGSELEELDVDQQRDTAITEGVCKKLGNVGSSCSIPLPGVILDPSQEIITMNYCPCIKDLECTSDADPQERPASCKEKIGIFGKLLNMFSPLKGSADEELSNIPEDKSNSVVDSKAADDIESASQDDQEEQVETQEQQEGEVELEEEEREVGDIFKEQEENEKEMEWETAEENYDNNEDA